MRLPGLLLVIGLAACGSPSSDDARLPPILHRLLLNENDDEITPVTYGHLFHLDAEAMEREMKCVDCHHHLIDDPEGIPVACATCHGPDDEDLAVSKRKGKVPGI